MAVSDILYHTLQYFDATLARNGQKDCCFGTHSRRTHRGPGRGSRFRAEEARAAPRNLCRAYAGRKSSDAGLGDLLGTFSTRSRGVQSSLRPDHFVTRNAPRRLGGRARYSESINSLIIQKSNEFAARVIRVRRGSSARRTARVRHFGSLSFSRSPSKNPCGTAVGVKSPLAKPSYNRPAPLRSTHVTQTKFPARITKGDAHTHTTTTNRSPLALCFLSHSRDTQLGFNATGGLTTTKVYIR